MWCHWTKLHLLPNVVLVKAMSQAQMFNSSNVWQLTFLLIVQFYPQSVNPLYINVFPTNKNRNFSV